MYTFIPVELKRPSQLNLQKNMPSVQEITMPFPTFFVILRIIMVIVVVFFASEKSLKPDSEILQIFACVAFALELTTQISCGINDSFWNLTRYEAIDTIYNYFFVIKWFLVAVVFGGTVFTADSVPLCLMTALACCCLVELFVWSQKSNYYISRLKELEDGLIEYLKKALANDYELGQPSKGELKQLTLFENRDDLEEKFWEGIEENSRDDWIVPLYVFAYLQQTEGGPTDYYVKRTEYDVINKQLQNDNKRMSILKNEFNKLRIEIFEQNKLITQGREKMNDYNADSTELKEVSLKTPIQGSLDQEKISGVLSFENQTAELYIKMQDYREMALSASALRNSIISLKQEKAQLNIGLQKGKRIINDMMKTMLKGDIKNSDEFVMI